MPPGKKSNASARKRIGGRCKSWPMNTEREDTTLCLYCVPSRLNIVNLDFNSEEIDNHSDAIYALNAFNEERHENANVARHRLEDQMLCDAFRKQVDDIALVVHVKSLFIWKLIFDLSGAGKRLGHPLLPHRMTVTLGGRSRRQVVFKTRTFEKRVGGPAEDTCGHVIHSDARDMFGTDPRRAWMAMVLQGVQHRVFGRVGSRQRRGSPLMLGSGPTDTCRTSTARRSRNAPPKGPRQRNSCACPNWHSFGVERLS